MPDFGDEMGEKLLRLMGSYLSQVARNAANVMFDAWRQNRAAKLAAAQEALGNGLTETTEEGFESMSADGKVLYATYKVGTNNELDLPDEATPADAVDGFYAKLKENLSKRECDALLSWSFDEDSNVLSYSVKSEGKDAFQAALKDTSLYFGDQKEVAKIHEQQAREFELAEEAEEAVFPEEMSFDVDLSKIAEQPALQNEICENMRAAAAQTSLAGKIGIGLRDGTAHVSVIREGAADPAAIIRAASHDLARRAAEIANEAKAAPGASWASLAHDTALADGLAQLADNLAPTIDRRVVCQFTNPEDGTSVAKEFTMKIPYYRGSAFAAAVKDLDQLIAADTKMLPDDSVFVTFDSPEAVEQSVRQLDWKLQQMEEARTFKTEGGESYGARSFVENSPYINQSLIDRAKQASEDLISGRAPTPPGYNPPIPKAPAPNFVRS